MTLRNDEGATAASLRKKSKNLRMTARSSIANGIVIEDDEDGSIKQFSVHWLYRDFSDPEIETAFRYLPID
jgi:hypothetical protein